MKINTTSFDASKYDSSNTAIHMESNHLFHVNEERRNMWVYYHHTTNSTLVFDPIQPTVESVQLLNSLKPTNIYFILTACQRKKKTNLKLWKKIFPNIHAIAPDNILIPPETVVSNDKITYLENFNEHICFLSLIIEETHCLCVKINQFIFIGELIHNIILNKFEIDYNPEISEFFHFYNNEETSSVAPTIIFPSLGPMALLSSIKTFNTLSG